MIYAAVSGSMMIVFIACLRLLFLRRLPKQCFRILWILAALRFLLPFSFVFEVEMPQSAYEAHEIGSQKTTVIDTSAAVLVGDAVKTSVSAADAVRIILPLGTLISGGFLTLAYLRMRRLAKSGEIVYNHAWGNADVRVGDGAATPFSCGLLRPIIFIPSHIFELDAAQLDIIISHERWHIKSGDQLVKWLIAAAVCLNWYNPLAWVMWCLSSRDIELACDEAVVRSGKDSADYALTLIDAEEVRSVRAVCSFGAPLLNERIECIMKSKKITVCGFVSAALILASASAFFVQVTAAKSEGDTPDTADDTAYEGIDYVADDTGDCYVAEVSDADDGANVDVEYEVADGEVEIELVPITLELTSPLVEHGAITGRFGEQVSPVGTVIFNSGVNVAAEEGTTVYAAASGTVIIAEYDYTNGNYIVIEHTDDCETVYRHLGEVSVEVGDEVEVGYEIATVGSTGSATGPNLGFAIVKDGAYVSPEELFE